MFVITGATGHVGSATAAALLKDGEAVTVVTRDAARAEPLRQLGATVAVADAHDVSSMRDVFRSGRRLFLLNPPAAPDTDTDAVEKETIRLLLAAIEGSGLEWIVAESTYGAQPGEEIGDLNTLFGLEEGLRAQAIPHAINRAAYYMSNWDMACTAARDEGVVSTFYPADLAIPMVAPADLGAVAARLLVDQAATGIHFVEGPERYSSGNVAAAFARALGREVQPVVTAREDWETEYRRLGFSPAAARSYARMTAISVNGDFAMPEAPIRGEVTLQAYINALVAGNQDR